MKFSILIPTWNNLPFLKLCIRSIEQNSQTDHEILIHINDGSDGTLEWVKENGYKYIHTKENIGVCWALNGLRSMVTTDYIVFVNDDMYMCPGWDKSFADEIRNIPDKLFFLASSTIQPEGHKLRP
ncbi:MAG: glycosyltransferase family 2 protein, partial [Muribaculaceae bacterium]|nr:glycosyltransferase family 2 protein [Muribaculaceae bacterium]